MILNMLQNLTEYIISKNMGFNVSGACYPEVHQEAESMIADIENLFCQKD